jgi:hypothetical protein
VKTKVLLVAVLLLAAYWFWPSGKRYPPGVLVPSQPRIVKIEDAQPWTYQSKDKPYSIAPQATYALEARVLSINKDYGDTLIGPVDITVGWGPMSDQSVLDRMQIWQDNTRRWYCRPKGDWPVPMDQVALHAVNTHVIPANPQIEKQLLALGKGDLIAIEGKLVNVSRDDGFRWNTSVDPSGFGDHSCKIIWVESLRRL